MNWIVEVSDGERYQALAAAYLAASQEKKKNGELKSALVVSPTHAESGRITRSIRDALKAEGKLGEERGLATWIPAQLTDAQKSDPANYQPGDMLRFHQNVPGHKIGSRLVVTEGQQLPVQNAGRFEVYRPAQLSIAAGERIRITANGKTKDGKHTLTNGSLLTVRGFNARGDLIVDHGWVIAKDWGHLAHGYAVTSHAAQGKTVDKVFIGLSSQSFPATNQRSFYVPVTRGREQALIFTDSKQELLKAVQRADAPMSATDLAQMARRRKSGLRDRLRRHLARVRRLEYFERTHASRLQHPQRTPDTRKEYDHAR